MSGLRILARVASASALCLLMTLAAGAGCAKKVVSSDEPTTKVPPVEDTGGKDVSAKGKKWSGWRWSGARDSCMYVVDNECFASEDKACAAANCGAAACRTKDGAPIVVSCKE